MAAALGDNRPHIGAIVVPDSDFLAEWAKKNGVAADLAHWPRHCLPPCHRAGHRPGQCQLSVIEKVKHFIVADEPFTVENGMMTPTMKTRRHVILRRWGA